MKILIVSSDEFGVIGFEAKYKGQLVADIIPQLDIEEGEIIDDDHIDYTVHEFDVPVTEAAKLMIKTIRRKCDHDWLKSECFYAENEIIQP